MLGSRLRSMSWTHSLAIQPVRASSWGHLRPASPWLRCLRSSGTPPPRRLNPTPNLSPDMTADSPDHCVDRTNPSRAQVDLGATASANPKGVCASFVQRLMVSSVRSGKILPSGQPGPALRPPDFAGGSSQHPRELSPRAEPGFRWWRLSNSDPLAEVWLSARVSPRTIASALVWFSPRISMA